MITEEEFLEAIYEKSHAFIEARGVPEKDIEGVLAAYRAYVSQRYADTYAKMEEKWDESVLASAEKYAERAKSIDLRPLYEAADAARIEVGRTVAEPVPEAPAVEEPVSEAPSAVPAVEQAQPEAPEKAAPIAVQGAPAVAEEPVAAEPAPAPVVEEAPAPDLPVPIALEELVEAAQPVAVPVSETLPTIESLDAAAPVAEPAFEPAPAVGSSVDAPPAEVLPVEASPVAVAAFASEPAMEEPTPLPAFDDAAAAPSVEFEPVAAEAPAPSLEPVENPLLAEFPFAQPAVAVPGEAAPPVAETVGPVSFPEMPAMSEPAAEPVFAAQDYAPADPFATAGSAAADKLFADAELPAFDDAELPAFDDALEDAFGNAFDDAEVEFGYHGSDADSNGIDDAVDEALIVDAPVFPGRQPVARTPEEEISDMSASAFELAKAVVDGAPASLDPSTCVSYCARLDELFGAVPVDKADKIKTQVMESKFDYMTAAGQVGSLSVRTQIYACRAMDSAARMDALRTRVTNDVAHEVLAIIAPLFAPETQPDVSRKLDHYYGVKVKRLFDQKIDEAHLAALPDVRRQLLDKEPPKFAGKDAASVMAMLESV